MRSSSSLSTGLLVLTLSGGAFAAGPSLASVAGRFPVPPGGTPEIAARAALSQALPLPAAVDLLRPRTTDLASGERIVRLAQWYRGVPVAHRGAAVTFARDGAARLVVARLEDDLPATVTPSIDAAAAASVARARTGLPADPASPILVIWPTADGNRLAWAVAPSLPGLPTAPVVVVDAHSGEVILRYESAVSLNLAKVYETNPVKSPTPTQVTLPVAAGGTTLDNPLVVSKNCIDKQHTTSFMGITAHVCDLLQTAAPDANGDYLIAPGGDKDPEDAFSEISMFHHVNRAYDFFRGFDPKLDVNAGQPLPTISNLRIPQGFDTFDLAKIGDPTLPLAPFQNAFFAPSNPLFSTIFGISGGAMWFGQGPVKDYSYDGDVVYHEFTHSVVNVTLQLVGTPHMDEYGASMAPGAMNEGLADFFSSALAGDPDVGEYASQDFAAGSTSIRTLDNKDACPATIGGEVHQDSTLFSGALWDARKGLTTEQQGAFDLAIFTAMNAAASGDLGYEDFAKLATDALTASSLGKTVADSLTAAFTAHGVLPRCDRILETLAGAVNKGPADLKGIWMAPGTQTTGASTSGYTPGVVQFHAKLTSGPDKVTVKLTQVDVGGGGILGGGGTPFEPKVLVRFGAEPIKFTLKPLKPAEGVTAVDPTASGNSYTAEIPVPAGASDVYVMIGSTGQSDGAYTNVSIDWSASSGTGGAGGGGGSAPSGSGGSGGAQDSSGGCGCEVPGGTPVDGSMALAAMAGLGLWIARRRRR